MSDIQLIKNLLHKLQQRIEQNDWHPIDLDTMLAHTRDLYEALLTLRTETTQNSNPQVKNPKNEVSTKESSGIFIEIPVEKHTQGAPEIVPSDKELVPEIDAEEGEIYNAEEKKLVSKPEQAEEDPAVKVESKKDIRKNIGINDRYLFMNELFHNDKFDYESVLDYINQSKSKKEVEAWLDAEYIQVQKWDKEDSTVALFYGLIDKHFSNLR